MLDNKAQGEWTMGLSASQARFLQLTARQSNVEYQAQQISFERLQLANQMSQVSSEYQDKTSNRKLTFTYRNGEGTSTVDVTYKNYLNYMNKQMEGFSSSQQKFYLVSSSGNKIIATSQDKINTMMEQDDSLKPENFMIVEDDLTDTDHFQQALKDGVYYFATMEKDDEGNVKFNSDSWENIGGGAISDVYDESDDKEAQAEYDTAMAKIEKTDKALEMELDRLETERNAIQTEIDSVSTVIKDNIESSFKTFS